MGIQGLLPFLSEATENTHISKFRGGTAAVDTYCWLHKGANACAEQLVRGDDTDVYIHYCLKYIKMLLNYDIHVIMVFDGKNLPAKSETESKRREQRQKAKQRAAELLRLGKIDEARNCMKQAIDITPKMAHKLIEECHKLNVDCIVAPYESDAQLAFFSMNNIADVIITEDSDLILFGCKKVMYKMDMTGAGQLVVAEKINSSMKLRPDVYCFDKFRFMCILSGCDYLSSLSGVGLKKALKFLTLTAETDPLKFLDKVPRYLNMRHLDVTEEYKENFMIAYATFKHQTVFDPFKKELVSLTDPADCGTDPKHCRNAGEKYNNQRALQVALGNMHPSKDEIFGNWYPPDNLLPSRSIWSKMYCKNPSKIKEKPKANVQFDSPQSYKKQVKLISVNQTIKTENDYELEDELAIYKKTNLIIPKKEESDVDLAVLDTKIDDTSPILGKNPFLKKKISKFPVTPDTVSGTVTKSRYFTKITENDENKSSSQIKSVNEETDDNMEESQPTNDSQTSITYKVSHLEIESSSSKKRSIDNISDITNTESDITYSEKITTVSQQSQENKKIKLGPCRSIGLKKKPVAGQKTIQQFFNQMKKS